MANVKTAISLDETLFHQLELMANELKISRSRLFALALKDFIEQYENRKMLDDFNAVYGNASEPENPLIQDAMRKQQRRLVEGTW